MLGVRSRASGLRLPAVSGILLLAIAVVAATAWSVIAAGWIVSATPALPAAVAAVIEAALLARAAAGRLVMALLAPLLGLSVVVPLTIGSMPPDGDLGIRHVVARYAGALATGLLSTGDWTFLVCLCASLWLVGYWVGWTALAEHRGVLAVLPVLAVLAPNAVNGPQPDQVAVPEALAVGLAVLLIAQCRLLELRDGWRRRRVVTLPGLQRRYTRMALVTTALIVVVGVATPAASNRDLTAALLGSVGRDTGHGTGAGGPDGGPSSRSSPRPGPATVQYSPDTRPGGPLTLDPQRVLTYTIIGGATSYLRVTTETQFVRGNWFPQTPADGTVESTHVGPGPLPRDRDPSSGGVGASVRPLTITVQPLPGATGPTPMALFAGDGDSIGGLGGNAVGAPAGPDRRDLLTVQDVELDVAVPEYTTGALVPTATEEQLRQATGDDPGFATDLASLPGGADPADIAALRGVLAQWLHGVPDTRYDHAKAIEQHLRDPAEFRYTLSPPVTRRGMWPITDFLTRTHEGYCQYFASSMGALLRLDGIPTRLVAGYGPGGDVDTAHGASDAHQVTTADAHVWVEAYFPRYGWVPFEPTPPSGAGDYQPFGRGQAPPPPPSTTPTPRPTPTPHPQATPTPIPPTSAAASVPPSQRLSPVFGWSLVGAVLLAGLLAGAWLWLSRPRTLGGMWRRFAIVTAVFGHGRRNAETYSAYVARLGAALPPDTVTLLHRDGGGPPGPRPVRALATESLELLADLSGREAFDPAGLNPKQRMGWLRSWQRLLRLWPLLVWRRLLAASD